MAMLRLIRRTVLGQGPRHFQKWFRPEDAAKHSFPTRYRTNKHNKQLFDYLNGNHSELLRRSALGLARTYNELPKTTVNCNTVADFQKKLQADLTTLAAKGEHNWQNALKPRKD